MSKKLKLFGVRMNPTPGEWSLYGRVLGSVAGVYLVDRVADMVLAETSLTERNRGIGKVLVHGGLGVASLRMRHEVLGTTFLVFAGKEAVDLAFRQWSLDAYLQRGRAAVMRVLGRAPAQPSGAAFSYYGAAGLPAPGGRRTISAAEMRQRAGLS